MISPALLALCPNVRMFSLNHLWEEGHHDRRYTRFRCRLWACPLSGYGCRKPSPGSARSRPVGRPSSSLWPILGRRAPLTQVASKRSYRQHLLGFEPLPQGHWSSRQCLFGMNVSRPFSLPNSSPELLFRRARSKVDTARTIKFLSDSFDNVASTSRSVVMLNIERALWYIELELDRKSVV